MADSEASRAGLRGGRLPSFRSEERRRRSGERALQISPDEPMTFADFIGRSHNFDAGQA